MHVSPRGRSGEEGFSLVELLVVIAILGVVGAVTLQGLVQGMRTNARVEQRLEAMATLERSSQRLGRDLRRGLWSVAFESGAQPRGCAVPAVVGTTPTLLPGDLTLITFHSGERFRNRIRLVGGNVVQETSRWTGSGWATPTTQTHITGLTNNDLVTYLDADGQVLTPAVGSSYTSADIRRVRKFELRMVVNVNGTDPIEVRTLVSPRNGGLTCPTT